MISPHSPTSLPAWKFYERGKARHLLPFFLSFSSFSSSSTTFMAPGKFKVTYLLLLILFFLLYDSGFIAPWCIRCGFYSLLFQRIVIIMWRGWTDSMYRVLWASWNWLLVGYLSIGYRRAWFFMGVLQIIKFVFLVKVTCLLFLRVNVVSKSWEKCCFFQ